jgi:hypothetical protein
MHGEWLFNWEELLPPGSNAAPDAYLPLRMWNGLKLFDGRTLPGKGYATYRMRVLLPPGPPSSYWMVLDPVIDACRLWVTHPDGHVDGPIGSGVVGTTRETTHGALMRSKMVFTAADEVIVTLQVSNFEHARGGSPGASPLLAPAEAADHYITQQRMADFFFIGLLTITGLHHIVLFLLRRREKAPLWFGGMCVLLALRLLLLGRYLQAELPGLPAWIPHRLEYITFYLPVPAAAMFVRELFPKYLPASIIKFLIVAGLAFTATLVLPRPVYSALVPIYHVITLIACAIAPIAVGRAALRERDAPPILTLIGLLALVVAAALDILRERSLVHIRFIAQYGLTTFVFFQSALLALLNQRRANQLELRNDEVGKLNGELRLLNDELRRQIASRSHELSQAVMIMAHSNGPSTLQEGDVVADQYRIVSSLGEGGMGTVFRAERIVDKRQVALKLIRGNADPAVLARFAREAEVVASIDHPNVVGILDFNVSRAGLFYLVMELVEGRTIEAERGRFGDVPWALPLVAQLTEALAAIHARDVIHRDVKPSNLLVADGRLKLADFGVAQMQRNQRRSSGDTAAVTAPGGLPSEETSTTDELAITRAGMMIGSPMYMAPELADGSEHGSTKSDMFSFGLVAYEMLAGKRAYVRPLVTAVIEGLKMPDPQPLTQLAPGLAPEVARLLHLCLHVSPAERPDAAVIVAAMQGVTATGDPSAA